MGANLVGTGTMKPGGEALIENMRLTPYFISVRRQDTGELEHFTNGAVGYLPNASNGEIAECLIQIP